MTAKEIEKILLADGWYHKNTKGSHKQFKHPTKPGKVTVTHPRKDIPIKTVKSICKQAGITLE